MLWSSRRNAVVYLNSNGAVFVAVFLDGSVLGSLVRSHTSYKFPDRARLWDCGWDCCVNPENGRGRGADVTVSRYGEAAVVLG